MLAAASVPILRPARRLRPADQVQQLRHTDHRRSGRRANHILTAVSSRRSTAASLMHSTSPSSASASSANGG